MKVALVKPATPQGVRDAIAGIPGVDAAQAKIQSESSAEFGSNAFSIATSTLSSTESDAVKDKLNEKFGIVGLLHDFDYERWPNAPDHPLQGAAILAQRGYPAEVIYAIKSHADYLTDCPRVSRLDKTLYACDELSGFITAVTYVRPSRNIADVEVKSVLKKLKTPAFAAGVDREIVDRGFTLINLSPDEHIANLLTAMKGEAAALGLDGPDSS